MWRFAKTSPSPGMVHDQTQKPGSERPAGHLSTGPGDILAGITRMRRATRWHHRQTAASLR